MAKSIIMHELQEKLKIQIIEQLNLEDVGPDDIDASSPLIGDELGLDSIDVLELLVLLEKEYGIRIQDPKEGKKIFYSLETLSEFVSRNQP